MVSATGDAPEAENLMAILPPGVLILGILPHLEPRSCVVLSASCKSLKLILDSDQTEPHWHKTCDDLGWGPFSRGVSWRSGFLQQRRRLCVKCHKPTRYVFPLMGSCRLCDVCEHHDVKYALVTACEAEERFGVSALQLKQLASVEACHTRLFLRSDVMALAQPRRGGAAGNNGEASSSGVSDEEGGGGGKGSAARQQRPGGGGDGGGGGSSDDGGSGEGSDDGDAEAAAAAAAAHALEREAEAAGKKTARKANKKQAKADQRSKREGKPASSSFAAAPAAPAAPLPGAASTSGAAPSFPANRFAAAAAPSFPANRFAAAPATAAAVPVAIPGGTAFEHTHAGGYWRGNRNKEYAAGASPPGAGSAGASPPAAGWAGRGGGGGGGGGDGGGARRTGFQRDGKKIRHREQQAAAAASGGKTRNQGRRGDSDIPMEGMVVLPGSSPKQTSTWNAEREGLMATWGTFGISGLVMSED